ncbi:MAG: phosphatidylglycerol lysyltransferase domain-containing protein [Synergistaceae bacterium]|jgi:hypothetical protein|nr:phosphatidylglycerol lysyltransferase domain-containing protein [Synergistaceae bacterium]
MNGFESFEPLTLDTKTLYDRYTGLLPGALASPLYFQSLYAWNFTSINRYKIFDEYLCFVAEDRMEGETFALPPLGALDGAERSFASAVRAVLRSFASEGLPCAFHETPGFMLPYFAFLDDRESEVRHDRDWSDYLFTRDDFIEGLQKSSTRELRRGFERKLRPHIREIASSDKDVLHAVTRDFFCGKRECADCFCGCELEVVSRMMAGWDSLDMKGVVVEIEGEAIAFGSVCFQKDTMLFLSKKVRRGTRGLNEYLNAALMDRFGGECKYVNYSDDMGSEGLRAYKSRLGRHVLEPRYVVRFVS